MKTPDEIKEWLGDPVPVHFHRGDPEPRLTPLAYKTLEEVFADALALIQQLQAENTEKDETIQQLESDKQQLEGLLTHMNQLRDAAAGRALKMEERVHQLEAERDAAVAFLKGQCWACKFSDCSFAEEPCASCFADRREKWQWRGVQKEESDDGKE